MHFASKPLFRLRECIAVDLNSEMLAEATDRVLKFRDCCVRA